MAREDLRLHKAQLAIGSIGLGFDITQDICFDNCKRGPRLIQINAQECRDLYIPGGVSIPNVPKSIKCFGGESHRIQSDFLTFHQMSEHFNMEMRLTSNIPSGHFCASFGLSGQWYKDAAAARSLAYDGWFIRRYTFELDRYDRELEDLVQEAMPLMWDPEALARFIQRFGTHIVLGVSMGGKDVLYGRQEKFHYLNDKASTRRHASLLQPTSLLTFLNDKASMRFTDSAQDHCLASDHEILCNNKENTVVIYRRRGGSNQMMRHREWLDTIDSEPDIILMFLLPLPTLMRGRRGIAYLSHAINLYVRYKPPIEDLQQFFEFQLSRQWAPVLSERSLGSHRKNQVKSGLRLGTLGPMLYINTIPVDVGNRPATGLRLQLEGTRSDRLAIHLEHLASLPKFFPLSDHANAYLSCDPHSCNFHQKVKWNCFSYVCTAPIESDDNVSIVTGAQLLVERNCLLLRLRFSKVIGSTLHKPPEWDQISGVQPLDNSFSRKSGCNCIFPFMTKRKEERKNGPQPGDVTVSSAPYHTANPAPVHPRKLQRFVHTEEIVRGPEDSPGYWVVSGAGLSVHNGEISIRVKYSLLNFVNTNTSAVP